MKRFCIVMLVMSMMFAVPVTADAGVLRGAARVASAPARFVAKRKPLRKVVRVRPVRGVAKLFCGRR